MKKNKKIILFILIILFIFFINTININAIEPGQDIDINISNENMTCTTLLGSNLTKVVHAFIVLIQIVGCIITIVKGMVVLIPPIMDRDASSLKKASGTLVKMAIILLLILLSPFLIRLIGKILGFDISCIF